MCTPHPADLSAEERSRLDNALLKFDKSWDEKRLPAALRQLPPTTRCGDPPSSK